VNIPVRFPLRPLFIVALLLTPGRLDAQGVPAAVAAAQRQLAAGHADSAVVTLEAFYRGSPNAQVGRLLLANAYRQNGDLDRALSAFEAVTQPRPARVQALFGMASIHAVRNAPDDAFRLLAQLKESGAFDMDLVRASKDFEPFRSDPRFERSMFRPEDFRHPFVEPVRVIHEWVGETKGDQFSWIARGIGDVDGDRVNDLVTSAPSYGAAGLPAGPGRVYVYSGRTGALLWTATGQPGDNLGTGLEGAGDVDGDGAGDVIAGAPGNGRAYV
jgi:hypothetical protein